VIRHGLGQFRAVDGVDQDGDRKAKSLRDVGESGSGKIRSMLGVDGLLPWTATVTADEADLDGATTADDGRQKRAARFSAMIWGDDLSERFVHSLKPCFTRRLAKSARALRRSILHAGRRERQKRAILSCLNSRYPDFPKSGLAAFPRTQMSAGMNQRVDDRHAIACKPKAVMRRTPYHGAGCDHSGAILDAGWRLREETAWRLGLDHDTIWASLRKTARTRSAFKYAGQKDRREPVIPLFEHAASPPIRRRAGCVARTGDGETAADNSGVGAGQLDRPAGCLFAPRCKFANAKCKGRSTARLWP